MEHGDEIADLLTLTTLMGGTMTRYETLNSVGRSSKKIVYIVKNVRACPK